MKEKINIRILSQKELESFFADNNEKPYRAKQVYEWLWKKSVQSFSEMTNLSQSLKELLVTNYFINKTQISFTQKSNDGTIKVSFILHDGNFVEGVLIPERDRVTACISSQVGCALNCAFCATGKYGFKRDLGFDEIFDEYVLLNKLSVSNYQFPISNIVYMGMGEPLLNYDNVLKSIDRLTSDDALGISPRRITLSTVGIPDKIKQLADDIIRNSTSQKLDMTYLKDMSCLKTLRINLAVSLHSANNDKRIEIVPVNKKYNLSELAESIKYFHKKTLSRITYEYLLLKDINDSLDDAKELAQFCKISPCKINLIEYNNNDIPGFKKSDAFKTKSFVEFLKSKNLVVQIRRSRGKDIHAACGQLANIDTSYKTQATRPMN